MAQEGIGAALKRLWGAFVSLVTTGSLHAEDAADKARSAEVLLAHVDEAAEQDAQRVLQAVDDGLTAWRILNNKADRQRVIVPLWDERAKTAVAKLKALAANSPERPEWEKLAKQALNEKLRAADRLAILEKEIEEMKPEAEAALKAAEQAGLSREQALDERDCLSIQNASADARRRLLDAVHAGGSELQKTMEEARIKVSEAIARAESAEAIAEVMPKDAAMVGAQIDALSRQGRVDEEFAAMMK